MALPAGVKDVKLNLTYAYRTTLTHIVAGDWVRVERRKDDGTSIVPSATHAPARSFWAEVKQVEKTFTRGTRRKQNFVKITLDIGSMPWDAPHTSITRKERETEHQARLEENAAARTAALAEARQEVWERIVADAKTALNQVPCTKCTGTADNHSYGMDANGGVEILCIGVAPVTIAQRKAGATAVPLEDPAVVVAKMVDLSTGDYPLIRRTINAFLDQELALPDCKEKYVEYYRAQLRVLTSMEEAVSATRPATIQVTHTYRVAAWTALTDCSAIVDRPNGDTAICGEPVNSPIHDPAAYLEYAAELKKELPRLTGEDLLGLADNMPSNRFTAKCAVCPWERSFYTSADAAATGLTRHMNSHPALAASVKAAAEATAALRSLQKELSDLRWEREKYATLLVDLVHMHEDAADQLRALNGVGADVHSATYATALARHNALQDVVNRASKKEYPASY